VKTMTTLINNAADARASLVGQPYYVSATVIAGGNSGSKGYGWGFTDAASEDPNIENPPLDVDATLPAHYVADTYEGCSDSPTEHEDQLITIRTAYLADIAARFDKRRLVVQQWVDSISQWSSHQPPLPPKTTPTIANDAVWTKAAPQGQNWVSGNAVSYAVAFANASGPSQYGDFSAWIEIGDQAFPTVTIPTDPLSMAETRWVYRKFRTGSTSPQLIGIVADATSTSWVDTHL
jgi:hypothetical protein